MKSQYNLLIAFFSVLFLINFIGATTLTIPADSGTVSGSAAVLNATNATATVYANIMNCTFYAKSDALTANTSWSKLGFDFNWSSTSAVNITFDSRVLEDGNDYVFNATCRNASNYYSEDLSTGVIVDNTVPIAPTLSPDTNTEITSSTTQEFTGTVVDNRTVSCTYTISKNGATSGDEWFYGAGTYSGTSCTYSKTFNEINQNGDWYWTMAASDGTNTTTSATNVFKVNLAASGGGGSSGSSGSSSSGSSSSSGASGGFSAGATPTGGFGDLLNNKFLIIGLVFVGAYLLFGRKR